MASKLPGYRPAFDPLIAAFCQIKKKKNVSTLMMGPPMGAMPRGVSPEVAHEFVEKWLPTVGYNKKKGKGDKLKTIRARLQGSADGDGDDGGGADLSKLKGYKKAFDPLIKLFGGIKKKKDVSTLTIGPPMGMCPKGMDPDVAKEFVNVFLVDLGYSPKKGKGEKLRDIRAKLGIGGSKGSGKSAGKKKSADPIAEMKAAGMEDEDILVKQGMSVKEIWALRSCFNMFDVDLKGYIVPKDFINFYKQFDKALKEDDTDFLTGKKCMRGTRPEAPPPAASKDGEEPEELEDPPARIDFAHFAAWVKKQAGDAKQQKAAFTQTWKLFCKDKGRSKKLSADDAQTAMEKCRSPMVNSQVKRFLGDSDNADIKKLAKDWGKKIAPGTKASKQRKKKSSKLQIKASAHPKYKKYFKLKSMKIVPLEAIKGKMGREDPDLDPDALDDPDTMVDA